jgi:nucleolar protein 56
MSGTCSLLMLELGLAVFDEDENLVVSKKFEDPIKAFGTLKNGESPDELNYVLDGLANFHSVAVNNELLRSLLMQFGFESFVMSQQRQNEIQGAKPTLIVKSGLAKDEVEASLELRDFAIRYSSNKVKEGSEKVDLHIVQAINALDEIDKIINVLGSRMREWYGLHFPELDNLLQSLNIYAEIVKNAGLRKNITKKILEVTGIQEKKMEIILDIAARSKGGEITEKNLTIVKKIADAVLFQSELRMTLTDHIEKEMEAVAPNIKRLLTSSVGARVIAKAGSLSRLAALPASTIQVLGAEKALFRALKTGTRPPKHGILFQHPLVHSAPIWQRGKIARAIASKVAIAARIDFYRHSGTADSSIADRLDKRIAEIQKKYKEPSSDKRRHQIYHPRGTDSRQRQSFRDKDTKRNKGKRFNRKKFGKRRY